MPVCISEVQTQPLKPLFAPTIRAFGFGARQLPTSQIVVSAGVNAKVTHHISLHDINGIRYWLPRAITFRKTLKLRLDIRQIMREVCTAAAVGTPRCPAQPPNPSLTVLPPAQPSPSSPQPHAERTALRR